MEFKMCGACLHYAPFGKYYFGYCVKCVKPVCADDDYPSCKAFVYSPQNADKYEQH